MNVALVQYSPEWENNPNNMRLIESILAGSATGADLLVFPEMTLTGFSMHPENLAEEASGPTMEFFRSLAQQHQCHVVFGMILREEGKFFNALYCLNPEGNIIGRYTKIHLFSYASEHLHYTPGGTPVICEIKGIRFGLSICYDLRFPELYRQYTRQGIDAAINIANWPSSRVMHWDTLTQARAIENQCYLFAVNRTGTDPFVSYSGHSAGISPVGDILIRSADENVLLQCELNPELIAGTRNRFPFLRDMKL